MLVFSDRVGLFGTGVVLLPFALGLGVLRFLVACIVRL